LLKKYDSFRWMDEM
jgi:hypothetical protein